MFDLTHRDRRPICNLIGSWATIWVDFPLSFPASRQMWACWSSAVERSLLWRSRVFRHDRRHFSSDERRNVGRLNLASPLIKLVTRSVQRGGNAAHWSSRWCYANPLNMNRGYYCGATANFSLSRDGTMDVVRVTWIQRRRRGLVHSAGREARSVRLPGSSSLWESTWLLLAEQLTSCLALH